MLLVKDPQLGFFDHKTNWVTSAENPFGAKVTHLSGTDPGPIGAPGGIRTPDQRIRNPLLYPSELRARAFLKLDGKARELYIGLGCSTFGPFGTQPVRRAGGLVSTCHRVLSSPRWQVDLSCPVSRSHLGGETLVFGLDERHLIDKPGDVR
jgi:hypothetical protein